jgi:hypothetical protein
MGESGKEISNNRENLTTNIFVAHTPAAHLLQSSLTNGRTTLGLIQYLLALHYAFGSGTPEQGLLALFIQQLMLRGSLSAEQGAASRCFYRTRGDQVAIAMGEQTKRHGSRT